MNDAALSELCAGMGRDVTAFARRLLVDPIPPALDAQSRDRIARLRDILDSLEAHASAPLGIAYEAMLDRTRLSLAYLSMRDRRTPQALANLDKLGAGARAFAERNPGAQPIDFVQYIRELELSEEDDREADPPSGNAVTIMTVHAAKGLEWPVVFVIDVWPQPPADAPQVLLDGRSGALLVREDGDGRRPFHAVSVERRDDGAGLVPRRSERARDQARSDEELRLFYVALTRARDELYVSGRRSYPSKDEPAGKPHGFLKSVIEWISLRGWAVDEPVPHASAGVVAIDPPLPELRAYGDPNVPTPRALFGVPALSFSVIRRYRECPRAVNYRIALRLPVLAGSARPIDEDDLFDDDGPLSRSAYGQVVHRAVQLWALSVALRTAGRPQSYVARAASDLHLRPASHDLERASQALTHVIVALDKWKPLQAEAPFTLELADVSVSGFIDLIARSEKGAAFLIDFKTGERPTQDYALQLGLYSLAAKRAYNIDVDQCFIGRIGDARFVLEPATVPTLEEIALRVEEVANGIRSGDLTAKPGIWCNACPYRAAPCMDYLRIPRASDSNSA